MAAARQFRAIFEQAAQFPGVQVLRHAVNLGKGAALKTGINHALCAFPGLIGIVTADADGQHHPEDIERVAASLLRESRRRWSWGARTLRWPRAAAQPLRQHSDAQADADADRREDCRTRRPDCAAFRRPSPHACCAWKPAATNSNWKC